MAMRSHYCGLVTEAQMGETVKLCGWVNRRRDHGFLIPQLNDIFIADTEPFRRRGTHQSGVFPGQMGCDGRAGL